MIVRLKQKPITLDAVQWDANEPEVRDFVGQDYNLRFKDTNLEVWNSQTQTWENCPHLSYIAKGLKGELQVIPASTLDRAYSVVDE